MPRPWGAGEHNTSSSRSHMPGSFGGESVPNTILLRGSSLANSTIRDWKHQPDSHYTFGVSIAIQNASNE